MLYIFICVALVFALFPFVYELANFVYGMEHKKRFFKRMRPWLFYLLLSLLTAALLVSSALLLWFYGDISISLLRRYNGAELIIIGAVYFFRLIPVYYDDKVSVQSNDRLNASFIKETVALVLMTCFVNVLVQTALLHIFFSFLGLCIIILRVHRFVKLKRGKRGK